MAFVNALAGLLPPQGYVPGFAGGMIGGYGQGDNQQWDSPFSISGPAQNIDPAQLAQLAQGAQQPKKQGGGGLRNILGMLGDSIMAAHGGERLYEKRHQEQQLNGALQNFLTDPDGAIAQVMQFDAPTAISLYKMVHPTPKEDPAGYREYQLYHALSPEEQAAYLKFKQAGTPSLMAPLTIPGNAQIEMPGATGSPNGPPQGAIDHLRANPGLAPQFDEKYGPGSAASVLGGASQPGSRTFP